MFSQHDGDVQGAIISIALGADLLERWNETTKIFTATPSIVPEARTVRNLTYSKAVELNYVDSPAYRIDKYGMNKAYGFSEKLFGLFARYNVACEHSLSVIHKMSIVVKSLTFNIRRADIINDIKRAIDPEAITLEKGLSITWGQSRDVRGSVFCVGWSRHQGSDNMNIIIGVSDED